MVRNQSGSVLLVVILVFVSLFIALSALFYTSSMFFDSATMKERAVRDFYVADGASRIGIAIAQHLQYVQKLDPKKKIIFPQRYQLPLSKQRVNITLDDVSSGISLNTHLISNDQKRSCGINFVAGSDGQIHSWVRNA